MLPTARRLTPADPLEEALLSRPLWDWRGPDPAVQEVLHRCSVGDDVGAVAAAELLLDRRSVPGLTVSDDVLDELPLDALEAALLSRVDGATPLARVLDDCGLDPVDAVRTLCLLLDRHLIVLRSRP